jgi:hypothetical protein
MGVAQDASPGLLLELIVVLPGAAVVVVVVPPGAPDGTVVVAGAGGAVVVGGTTVLGPGVLGLGVADDVALVVSGAAICSTYGFSKWRDSCTRETAIAAIIARLARPAAKTAAGRWRRRPRAGSARRSSMSSSTTPDSWVPCVRMHDRITKSAHYFHRDITAL